MARGAVGRDGAEEMLLRVAEQWEADDGALRLRALEPALAGGGVGRATRAGRAGAAGRRRRGGVGAGRAAGAAFDEERDGPHRERVAAVMGEPRWRAVIVGSSEVRPRALATNPAALRSSAWRLLPRGALVAADELREAMGLDPLAGEPPERSFDDDE